MSGGLPERVREAAERFLSELSKYVRVREAYLFGSYVRGDWLESSDLDLIVVSEDFEGMGLMERLELVEALQWRLRLRPHIGVLPYTPEEFEDALEGSAAVRDAARYWVRVR